MSVCYYFFFFLLVSSSWSSLLFCPSDAQQTYINNKQLDCYNNLSLTNGYLCNGPQRSCKSYITFRSQPPYDSASQIGYLLGASPPEIADINNITDVENIPKDTLIIVPVTCSCSGGGGGGVGGFYQHNSSYALKSTSETYFSVANDTYQGLTSCQALMSQNSVDSRKLFVGLKLTVPLRCACPTKNQTDSGIRFLLSYLVTWRDSISSIAETFFGSKQGTEEEEQSITEANELSGDSIIFPFTPLLVPLKTQPTITKTNPNLSPPPATQAPPISEDARGGKNKKKWGIIGIAIGLSFLLALSGFLVWFFLRRSRLRFDQKKDNPILPKFDGKLAGGGGAAAAASSYTPAIHHDNDPSSVSLQGVRYAMDSLILYKFEVLQNATEFFREDNRIKGSVYQGLINGDTAAIKRMKGDVSNEISILKQINHSNVIRLSGFCVNQGNTYLVYEFAENGSLSDWLHENDKDKDKKNACLGWKQRVQIAYHVADGLNYLHNYANPPYIHKDLKSSNILLDSNFRAKIANFGVARALEVDDNNNNEGGDGALQLTRHVVGTQGYMAPEYLENGVITPKLDVFSFGVVMLELLSGKEAATTTPSDNGKSTPQGGDTLLSASIKSVLEGEDVRAKLIDYIDPSLRQHEYPLDLAFSMAQLARDCVAPDLNSRPTMLSVFMSISKILSSSLDWDPSNELEHSRSLSHGR